MKNTTVKKNKLANKKMVGMGNVGDVIDRNDNVHSITYICKECGDVSDNFQGLGGHIAAHNIMKKMEKAPSISVSATDGQNKDKSIYGDETCTSKYEDNYKDVVEVSDVYTNSQHCLKDSNSNKRDAHLGLIKKAMKNTAVNSKNTRTYVCKECGKVFDNF